MNLATATTCQTPYKHLFFLLIQILATIAVFSPQTADCHANSRIYMDIEANGRNVQLTLRSRPIDLAPLLNIAQDVVPLPALYRMQKERILGQVRAFVTLVGETGRSCLIARQALATAGDEVKVTLNYRCPYGPLRLNYHLLFDSDPAHTVYVSLRDAFDRAAKAKLVLLKSTRRSLDLSSQTSALTLLREFVTLGADHILSGADHLLFIFVLLLAIPGQRESDPKSERGELKKVLVLVTAFTIAHSLTLAVAALRVFNLPSRLVESAIALTILYVALENLWARAQRHRWWLVFAFGLIHGFGFAQILSQTGLPNEGRLLSLFAFNLGVELGQVLVVLLTFPILEILADQGLGVRRALISLLLAVLLGGLLWAALWSFGIPIWPWSVVSVTGLIAMFGLARLKGYGLAKNVASLLVGALALIWLIERAFLA